MLLDIWDLSLNRSPSGLNECIYNINMIKSQKRKPICPMMHCKCPLHDFIYKYINIDQFYHSLFVTDETLKRAVTKSYTIRYKCIAKSHKEHFLIKNQPYKVICTLTIDQFVTKFRDRCMLYFYRKPTSSVFDKM